MNGIGNIPQEREPNRLGAERCIRRSRLTRIFHHDWAFRQEINLSVRSRAKKAEIWRFSIPEDTAPFPRCFSRAGDSTLLGLSAEGGYHLAEDLLVRIAAG